MESTIKDIKLHKAAAMRADNRHTRIWKSALPKEGERMSIDING